MFISSVSLNPIHIDNHKSLNIHRRCADPDYGLGNVGGGVSGGIDGCVRRQVVHAASAACDRVRDGIQHEDEGHLLQEHRNHHHLRRLRRHCEHAADRWEWKERLMQECCWRCCSSSTSSATSTSR